jgi:hypothetical protein
MTSGGFVEPSNNSITQFTAMFVTPKATAKHELLFDKPALVYKSPIYL